MDRRTYIKQLALVTGGALILPRIIVSCGDDLKPIELANSLEPFRSLEEIRHFVRLSKGHLKLELDRLIKKKNAEEIFDFINQRIATIPARPDSITSSAYETRWGQQAMLRCGKGTLREKSDLLLFMLSEAGFEPSYHRASFAMNRNKVQEIFCRDWEENNEIEIDEAYLEKWDQHLTPTDSKVVTKNVDPAKSIGLFEELESRLPEGFENEVSQMNWLNTTNLEAPIVRVSVDGTTKDLNFVENKPFADFGKCEYELYELDADQADAKLNKARVTVHFRYSDQPTEKVEIVSGEWEMKDLLGSQIALQCVSTIPQEMLLQTPIMAIQQFVPSLSLQNSKIPETERINYASKGVGFDLMGNTFREDSAGNITMNGLVLSESNNQDTSKVKSLKVELLDNQYPTIKLKCLPLDAFGKAVQGLSGSAFEIVDQGKKQLPVVLQNSIARRILVFFDSTASMPYPYAASSIPEETMMAIREGFEKLYSSVVIETRMFQLEFLQDIQSIELKAYDHVLCIGDGEAFENVSPSDLKKVVGENSISYHFVNNESARQSINDVKRCFEGAEYPVFRIESLENDIRRIGTILDKKESFPYLLSYEAPYEGDDLIHPVTIAITDNASVPEVKKRYVMNREKEYETRGYPCGVSMTLDWDEAYSSQSITKHIAGFNPEVDKDVVASHKEEMRSFALGTHRIFFEPDKATLPVLLDEMISAQLSVAQFFEHPKQSLDEQLEQINRFKVLPSAGLSVFSPLPKPGSNWVTYENNFQTCLYSEFIDFNRQKSFKKVDVWETSDIHTLASTSKEAFLKTLEATSLLAVSEGSLFQESTMSELSGKSIALYKDDTLDFEAHPEWRPLYTHSYNNHLLYDASFQSAAYWKIKKSTGALIGIMPDGSGGGIEAAIAHNLKIIDSYAGAYNKAAAPLMSDPLAFGTVTMYGQFLARLYGLVCVAVLSLDAAELPVKSRKAIKKLAYGVIKSFAFAKFGKLKQFEKILDKLFDPGWPKIE